MLRPAASSAGGFLCWTVPVLVRFRTGVTVMVVGLFRYKNFDLEVTESDDGAYLAVASSDLLPSSGPVKARFCLPFSEEELAHFPAPGGFARRLSPSATPGSPAQRPLPLSTQPNSDVASSQPSLTTSRDSPTMRVRSSWRASTP